MCEEYNIEKNSPEDTIETAENQEISEFEIELENYLPTPENTDKVKKPTPHWVLSLVASFVVCVVVLCAYSFLILPKIYPRAVITYSQGTSMPESGEALPLGESISQINDSVSKSIVTVESTASYRNFFGISTSTNSGSGIIITDNGYILTSYSLIGAEGETMVIMPDKKEYSASLAGVDKNKDIAVIKINANQLPYVTLGNSDNVKAGDSAIVIGDTSGSGLGTSVTRGIICAVNSGVTLKNGDTINLFQTDAITGTGSTGGCLLNSGGEVVGMVTAAITSNNEKISFAIPSNDIKNTIESLINTGKASETPMIGITGMDGDHGVTIESVIEDTPAKRAGLKAGDLILQVDGTPVTTIAEINKIRNSHKKGDKLVLTIYRVEGEITEIDIIL